MRPFTLLIKPSGSDCNLDCGYCFYKNRPDEFGSGRQRMDADVLERLIAEYMSLGFDVAGFAWQGGEPTLMGMDFFAKALELQKHHGRAGIQISNKIQTNAVVLDDDWCRFLADNRFLLGISVDGPERFHDAYRMDHSGKGTFSRVMAGIENCRRHGVQFSVLMVLTDANVRDPEALFEWLVQNELSYVQFIPCVERDPADGRIAEFSITPEQYGDFLCRMFDLWIAHGPGKMNIRLFDSITSYFVLGDHTMCAYRRRCEGFVVVEHTGDVFCCEFFVEPRWRVGNIMETPLASLAGDRIKRDFARRKRKVGAKCLLCRHLEICRGGCMKDRVRMVDGETDCESYFCRGYRRFFDHSLPKFMQLAAAIESGSAERCTRDAGKIRLTIE